MTTVARILKAGLLCLLSGLAGPALAEDCAGDWRVARLTTYTSYPEPGSEECIDYSGCEWAGQFYGLPDKQTPDWVAAHDIAAVHQKDWTDLGMKVLELRQGARHIRVQVLDLCADADCDGCCTKNLGGDGYLIDLEGATAARFGSGDGVVEFRVCEGDSGN
jgi:hypothetical protein